MLQLIINADDLGLTPGCISGIVRAMTEGIVSDTTLMVNTTYTDDAVAALKARGIARAGLHLNLTYGAPLLPVSEVPSLVDEQGFFRRRISQSAPIIDPAEAAREFAAQAERFRATGLGLTHLDSHHHAHTYPGLLEAAIDLARQLGVPLRQGGDNVRQRISEAGVATTDYIVLDFYEQGATIANLQQIIGRHRQGTLEIMCHPAEPEELIHKISSYNVWREKELAVLTSREMRDFLREQGVRLVSFDALHG